MRILAPAKFLYSFLIVLFALVSPFSFAESFMAKVVGVSDGDTVNVLTDKPCNSGKNCKSGKIQYRVRLAEIDTPEKKQPYGSRSKQALSDLVFGRLVKVDTVDTDRYGRLVANLYVDGKWVILPTKSRHRFRHTSRDIPVHTLPGFYSLSQSAFALGYKTVRCIQIRASTLPALSWVALHKWIQL